MNQYAITNFKLHLNLPKSFVVPEAMTWVTPGTCSLFLRNKLTQTLSHVISMGIIRNQSCLKADPLDIPQEVGFSKLVRRVFSSRAQRRGMTCRIRIGRR